MISQEYRTVVCTPPFDVADASTHTAFNMGKAHKATIFFVCGAMNDGDTRVTLRCGATSSTDTNVFTAGDTIYMKATEADVEAASGDLLTADVALESSQAYFLLPTTDKRLYALELDASVIPAGKPWVKVQIGNEGNTANMVCAFAILQMRYSSDGTVIG